MWNLNIRGYMSHTKIYIFEETYVLKDQIMILGRKKIIRINFDNVTHYKNNIVVLFFKEQIY